MKVLGLALASLLALAPVDQQAERVATDAVVVEADQGTHGWVAKKDDCICGISDLRKVSNPAKVDYDKLMSETPQMKEMKKKRIDPQSREGRALKSKAKTLVARTCRTVQQTKGHCGIWKKISHKDKRTIADITADVSAEF